MALTTLSGTISNIRHSTETSGQVGRQGGAVGTAQVLAFRVDNTSAQIKLKGVPDIQDGDPVTLAGSVKNGTFVALAMRNDKTNAVYTLPAAIGFFLGGMLILLGILTLACLVGIVFIGAGIYTLWEASNYQTAANLLKR